ncbi:MAG: L-histidine N(alpha)-methyltransferase [Acidimicrobiia bacterium]
MPTPDASTPRVDVHLTADDLRAALRLDADQGLRATPKDIPPKWFYDTRGSQLFDDITRLPEYYPTRCERAILEAHAHEIAQVAAADTLVELGSGTSEKTRILLDAMRETGIITRFVPFDVSEQTLREAAAAVTRDYPTVRVHAVVGDFEHHLGSIPGGGRRLVAFLGGTIGNLEPPRRADFLREIASGLGSDDHLLLGLDLVKDIDRLEAAYDDSRGVTAAFNKNVLAVMNRELDADFDDARFEHVAVYEKDPAQIEMRLRAVDTHTVQVRALALTVPFVAGEEMRTEVSAKFTREQVIDELDDAGMVLTRWWTDRDGDFAVLLARR